MNLNINMKLSSTVIKCSSLKNAMDPFFKQFRRMHFLVLKQLTFMKTQP